MRLIAALMTLAALIAAPAPAHAAKVRGMVSGSVYNHDDDVSAQDFTVTRFNVRLSADEIAGEGTYLTLRATTRSAGSDYNRDIPGSRVETLVAGANGIWSFLDVAVGRQWLRDIPTARVDGAAVTARLGDYSGVGLFGGQAPDPYNDTVSGDYTTFGGYAFYRAPEAGVSGGYVATLFKGNEDLSFISGAGYLAPSTDLRLYATARSDHNVASGQWETTNLSVSLNYRAGQVARLGAAYNQYRAVRRYESMDYSLNYDLQTTMRFSGDFNVTPDLSVYGRFDARTRETDSKSATLYVAGVRQKQIMDWLYYDISYRGVNYFTSTSSQYAAAVGADLDNPDLTAELSASLLNNEQDGAANSLRQMVYGGSVDWRITDQLYTSGKIEVSNEQYLDVDSIYTAKATDTYNAMTFFLYAGYNF